MADSCQEVCIPYSYYMYYFLQNNKFHFAQYCHLLGHVQKLVQVHSPVGELPEGTLLLDLGIRLAEM